MNLIFFNRQKTVLEAMCDFYILIGQKVRDLWWALVRIVIFANIHCLGSHRKRQEFYGAVEICMEDGCEMQKEKCFLSYLNIIPALLYILQFRYEFRKKVRKSYNFLEVRNLVIFFSSSSQFLIPAVFVV